MKLFEALALKKALQNQLTQLISIRNSTFEYPEDEKPEFNFQELTSRIKEKVNEMNLSRNSCIYPRAMAARSLFPLAKRSRLLRRKFHFVELTQKMRMIPLTAKAASIPYAA